MAKKGIPQLENGFARVASEILEAIARTSLSDYESRFIHFLWRKTYGWQNPNGQSKKFDSISHSQWATGTSIPRRHVSRVLDRLVKRNIVAKIVHFASVRKIILWGFQKRYREWLTPLFEPPEQLPPTEVIVEREASPELVTATLASSPLGDQLSPPKGAKLPPPQGATKDNKDTNTKDLIPPTTLEAEILSIFKKFKGWSFSEEEDLEWLRDFLRDDPETTIRDIKKCRDFYSGRLLPKNKGPWKVRFRNWMDTQKKMASKSGYRGRAGQVPSTAEIKEQAKEKGVV
ncbi:MAG: replication protein [Dehalococcoidia bacterium]|nr:replication protein [Dehalococcoidia bacterium]